jgi:hypothetical protein
MPPPKRLVHARLDAETARILERLRRRTGATESELIRRAVRILASAEPETRARKVVGFVFASGVRDLASNPAHLRGFGKK